MNGTNIGGIHISEFERRVPKTAKLKYVRLDDGRRVVFAMGYNVDETVAVVWYRSGKAWAWPLGVRAAHRFREERDFRVFNGHVCYRRAEYDLV